MSRLFLIIGILLLLATEFLRVYFIMPFPGSQQSNTIDWAFYIEKYKWLLRIIGLLLIAKPVYELFTGKRRIPKILFSLFIVVYLVIFFFFNFRAPSRTFAHVLFSHALMVRGRTRGYAAALRPFFPARSDATLVQP